jgi:hypothetical protein
MFHQEESQNPLFIHDRERKNQHRDCIHTALLHTTTTCEDLMTGTWQPEQFSRLAASRNPRAQTSLSAAKRKSGLNFHHTEAKDLASKPNREVKLPRSVIADLIKNIVAAICYRFCDKTTTL